MNSEKTAVIDLLNQLAKELNLTIENILRLYDIAGSYIGIQEARVFYGLIKACTFQSYRSQIDLFLSKPVGLPISNDDILTLTCYGEGYRYFYLYDLITVGYYGGGLFKGSHQFSYAWESKITVKNKVIKPAVIADQVIVVANEKEVKDFGNSKTIEPIISTTPVVWGVQQAEALDLIYKWLRNKNKNSWFYLAGYAGTGKTKLMSQISTFVSEEQGKNNVPSGEVLYAAYTNRVAAVLRSKGCLNAATLHSLLYKPVIDADTGRCTGFVINHQSPISTASVLVIDEISMVSEEMALDILSFNTPVLVVGDPAQLPPVKGTGYFIERKPDYLLTDIRRQEKGNPIIYLATRVREGKTLNPGKYGNSIIYEYGNHVSDELILNSTQVIVGLNATRKHINTRVRKLNGKFDKNPIFPVKGDRLICTKNNLDKTLANGTLWRCSQPTLGVILQPKFKNSTYKVAGSLNVLKFKVQSEDELDSSGKLAVFDTQCALHHFDVRLPEPNWKDMLGSDDWDFAYAITCHKLQGSQVESALIFDESSTFREHAKNWLYTAITRAIDKVTIQQS
jgi:exodeoxyribonuclease-5